MLPDRYQQLLTAFVDGELSGHRRRQVARLLAHSAEARQFLQRLQEDAAALRAVPPVRPQKDLTAAILGAIVARPTAAPAPSLRTAIVGLPSWASVALAALLLLAIGLGSFVYFARFSASPARPAIARLEPGAASVDLAHVRPTRPEPVTTASTPKTSRPQAAPQQRPPAAPAVAAKKRSETKATPGALPPAKAEDDILTDRLEMFRIDRVDVALPTTYRLQALTQNSVRQQLLAEVRKAPGFRVELPCRDGAFAWKILEPELSALGLALAIDQAAQQRLRIPQLRTNFVVYVEDVLPEELARLLEAVGRQDRTTARKTQQLQFSQLVLTRLTPQDHKELATLLGTDPARIDAPRAPSETDLRKPLTEVTARQVADSLAGQGRIPRPSRSSADAGANQRLALVLAYNPVRPRPGSAEVQRFLQSRKPVRRGALRVLLVLRG